MVQLGPLINGGYKDMDIKTEKPKQRSKAYYFFLKLLSIFLIVVSLLLSIVMVIPALIFLSFGCWGIHYCAKAKRDTKPFYKKRWQIVIAVLFVVLSVSAANMPKNITSMTLETDLSEALQVPNSKDIVISYSPANADNIDDIACYVKDADIADLEVKSTADGKITYELTPKAKGKTSIICTANDYETKFNFEVSTSELEAKEAAEKAEAERIAAEKKAEEERLAAEKAEQERLAAEQKAAEEKAAQEQAAAEQAAQEQAAQEQQQEQMVYITPSGERYHLDASCGGKNSYQVPISQIGGRTPCKKCAGG